MVDKAPTDVGDVAQVKKGMSKQKLKRLNELEEIKQLLSTSFGKGFLWRVLSECYLFKSISHQDVTRMNQLSGRRDFGLWLINEINAADPNGYMKLIQEDAKRDIDNG